MKRIHQNRSTLDKISMILIIYLWLCNLPVKWLIYTIMTDWSDVLGLNCPKYELYYNSGNCQKFYISGVIRLPWPTDVSVITFEWPIWIWHIREDIESNRHSLTWRRLDFSSSLSETSPIESSLIPPELTSLNSELSSGFCNTNIKLIQYVFVWTVLTLELNCRLSNLIKIIRILRHPQFWYHDRILLGFMISPHFLLHIIKYKETKSLDRPYNWNPPPY